MRGLGIHVRLTPAQPLFYVNNRGCSIAPAASGKTLNSHNKMNTNKTVLLISNSKGQFDMAASLLRNNGYRVLFENDTFDALALAANASPDLIVSELAAPNVDGLKLCFRASRDRHLRRIPILLVGELSHQSSIVADGLRSGAADYLQKPVDHSRFLSLCESAAGPVCQN
jgi:PleD family two-component response regulator